MIRVTDGVFITRVLVRNVEAVLPYLGSDVQLVNTNCWRAVAFASILALRAFERKTNHAKTLGGELLLRLAGTLQIKDAIMEVGVKPGENYLVVFGDEADTKRVLEDLGLEELPIDECPDEITKTFFEKSALVEVL
ncbi:KEOPS complex subunit Cgi121 [Thermococcus henrietii]|uniref:KEOPS complex subunit Cgi121 n=1 Tax=Thermococcus henrietii TaxID=2016361 RepID=UPI000C07AB0F|nr:KEOPS complex subunit Cgi121 [Thermococcus henrietii]